ncbi:MAG: FMN-binding protein [Gammaproteobacteria bacterium]|nr:FMN-binding protein [Gammaproteobacteria bacterium]
MILGMFLSLLTSMSAAADRLYQTPNAFVDEAFAGVPPAASALWLQPELRSELGDILGHRPSLRIRYWSSGGRTAWIFDEIGKTRPITTGVVVNAGAIEDIRVLVFRESRGWEVKHSFFTRQFHSARLADNQKLDRHIDGITGATFSVRAMKRVARAALFLHEHSQSSAGSLAQAR